MLRHGIPPKSSPRCAPSRRASGRGARRSRSRGRSATARSCAARPHAAGAAPARSQPVGHGVPGRAALDAAGRRSPDHAHLLEPAAGAAARGEPDAQRSDGPRPQALLTYIDSLQKHARDGPRPRAPRPRRADHRPRALIDERLRLHRRRAREDPAADRRASRAGARDRPGAVGQRRRHAGLPDALRGARPRRPAARDGRVGKQERERRGAFQRELAPQPGPLDPAISHGRASRSPRAGPGSAHVVSAQPARVRASYASRSRRRRSERVLASRRGREVIARNVTLGARPLQRSHSASPAHVARRGHRRRRESILAARDRAVASTSWTRDKLPDQSVDAVNLIEYKCAFREIAPDRRSLRERARKAGPSLDGLPRPGALLSCVVRATAAAAGSDDRRSRAAEL